MTPRELRLALEALREPRVRRQLAEQIRGIELQGERSDVWTFTIQHELGPRFCLTLQLQRPEGRVLVDDVEA